MVSVVSQIGSSYLLKQSLAALSCSLFCIVCGCILGFTAVLLPQIKEDPSFPYSRSHYDSWIASSACLAMALGSIMAGIISDKYGRKMTQLAVAPPLVIGWICMAFARNVVYLLIGRVLTGVCYGALRSISAIYIGEIASPTHRPFFIFSLTVATAFGNLLSHVLGGFLNWRISCLIMSLPAVLGVCLLVLVKESPLWLIYKGKIESGTEAFIWFRGKSDASRIELEEVLEQQKNKQAEMSMKEGFKTLFSKAFIKPLVTAFLLFTTVQFSGVNTMSFYAQDLLKTTFSEEQNPFVLMLITDAVRLLAIVLLFVLSKYIPRKKTYVITNASLVALLLAIISYLALNPAGLEVLAVTVLMFYIALGSVMIGLGWTFIGEIFPSNLRGLGSGIGASVSFFHLFLSVYITPGILTNYGIIALYSTYAMVTFSGFLFLYWLLPQTDGKTLQQIENSYKANESRIKNSFVSHNPETTNDSRTRF